MAVYSDRFMVAKTRASDSTGHHCGQVNRRTWGRPTTHSSTPATHWRTATTPAGPITGKASAPVAAPTWLDRALPSIRATPAERSRRPAARPGAGAPAAPCSSAEVVMEPSMGRDHTYAKCI
jgi:hypothetical protein